MSNKRRTATYQRQLTERERRMIESGAATDEEMLRSDLIALQKKYANMVAFIAEFEDWILVCKENSRHNSRAGDSDFMQKTLYATSANGVVLVWQQLKAQHLAQEDSDNE